MKRAVVLVGHGAPPTNVPTGKVERLKRLEGERRRGGSAQSEEEAALDLEIRSIPRTPHNDPYFAGIEALAAALRRQVQDPVRVAYNEFCAPSLETALRELIAEGITLIIVVSTMMTPGGVHSAVEIPETLQAVTRAHPGVDIRYAWPFELDRVATLLAEAVTAQEGRRA